MDIARAARVIYRRMPRIRSLMDLDDIRQECELQRLRGEARSFHQLHCHVIDIARHFGGRDGRYLGEPLPRGLATRPGRVIERRILIRELLVPLTPQQRRVTLLHLEGKQSAEIGVDLGITPHSVDQYSAAALKRMRRLV